MRTAPATKQDIGRAVHWFVQAAKGPSPPIAAIITDVHDGENVALALLHPSGLQFHPMAVWSLDPKPLHWSWPPWSK